MKLHERSPRRMQRTLAALVWSACSAAVLFSQEHAPFVTETNATWESHAPEQLELRLSGPGALFWSRVFAPGEIVEVATDDLVAALGDDSDHSASNDMRPRPDSATSRLESAPHESRRLQDGMYNWELRERSDRRDSGVWRGRLEVKGGRFLAGRDETPLRRAASADQVIADDLIADRACFGPNCVDGELFGSEQLKLSAAQPGLLFDSSGTDWRIDTERNPGEFNLSQVFSGGSFSDRLSIDAFGSGLFLTPRGVGIDTSAPAATLHVLDGTGTASMVLEGLSRWEIVSTGVTGSLWIRESVNHPIVLDIMSGTNAWIYLEAGSNANFHLTDTNEVILNSGMGSTQLSISGTQDSDTYAAFGAIGRSFNVGYSGSSFGRGSGFLNIRPNPSAVAPNPSIRFMIANQPAMILDNEGYLGLSGARDFNPEHPIELESGAHVTVGGVWTNASSRTLKTDIEPLPTSVAMATLEALQPVRFRYTAEPDETYLGFIAEDAPQAVAHGDRKALSPMDLVAVLTEVVQLQATRLERLEERIDAQERELARQRVSHELSPVSENTEGRRRECPDSC